jgi:hypothetical protein
MICLLAERLSLYPVLIRVNSWMNFQMTGSRLTGRDKALFGLGWLFRGNLHHSTFPLNLQENVRLQIAYNSLMKANWY